MRKSKEYILKKIKEFYCYDNFVEIESMIKRALIEYRGDVEFINELFEYQDDLKIKNFMNSLGDNAEGFQIFMFKFRKKLINDIKGEITTKQE